MVALIAMALLAGCDRAEEAPGECLGGPCLEAWATSTWAGAPDEVLARLEQEADPAVRLGVAMAVVEAHPQSASRVCGLLPKGPVSRRCLNIADRPHLWTVTPERSAVNVAFNGEVEHTFALQITNPYAGLAPLTARCDGTPQTTCQADAALQAALTGDMPTAAGFCMGVGEGKWRSECFFDVAEELCGAKREGSCGGGARLCLGAGQFLVPCLVEVAGEVALLAPPATASAKEDWARLLAGVGQAAQALARDNPELARRFEDRVWAEAMLRAYASSPAVGNPLRFVPAEAKPHVRAAIARRLASTPGPPRGLLEWAGLVEAAERSEGGAPESPPARMGQPRGLWATVMPQERALAVTAYLGDARRALHTDPEMDRLICVLEAVARRPTPGVAALVEGTKHPDRLVRWTAVRLLKAVEPSHVALQQAQKDTEPAIRARATEDS